ncbi:MAG TPA: SDR family NAD(P)-dependent oxidoreductase [Caulobacteraceae bacterium]|jgi:short-subunit dehydrogenase|nr:SDR family NAD(P)-dependent oxidoreductase [Caulobacteraceae bacterium]
MTSISSDDQSNSTRPLAVVTGASSGIGYELAKQACEHGYDLIIAADQPSIAEAADAFRRMGATVDHLCVDLSTREGVEQLLGRVAGRPIDALMANAGQGLGHGFLEQDWEDAEKVIDTNIKGTCYLLHRALPAMRDRGSGKVLITGSIAGLMPGAFQAVYNGTKAFLDSFSWAIRDELKDSGVTITCLMPGATDTEFFARADMLDTKIGADPKKADPADVAKVGFEAMQKGEGDVVAGLKNKITAATAAVTPQSMLAEQHRKLAEPGSAG